MKPSLSVWTEIRFSAGGAEAFVLSAQAPGKKGRGVRLTSRSNEQEILDLKRQLENSDLTDISDMKLHVAKRFGFFRFQVIAGPVVIWMTVNSIDLLPH